MSGIYAYRPLQTQKSIRLLRLNPGMGDSPLRGTIYHIVLEEEGQGSRGRYVEAGSPQPKLGDNKKEVYNAFKVFSFGDPIQITSYEALSYVWGPAIYSQEIATGEGIVRITPNLAQALQNIRHPQHYRTIWADAICINQRDLLERGHQVRSMGRIYSRAEGVLIWLGQTSDDEAESCFDDLRLAEKLKRPHVTATEQVYKLQWFTRLWVVQEIFLAREANFLWKDSRGVHGASRSAVMLDYQKRALRDSRLLDRWQSSKAYNMRFLDMLEVTQNLLYTDERDRIYAILGLPYDSFYPLSTALRNVQPDYSKSTTQVFIDIASLCVENYELPRVLSQKDVSRQYTLPLPSWVPDWSWPNQLPSRSERFIFPDWNFLPSLREGCLPRPNASVDRLSGTLTIRGHILGRVTKLLSPPGSQDPLESAERAKSTETDLFDALPFALYPQTYTIFEHCDNDVSDVATSQEYWFHVEGDSMWLGPRTTQPGDVLVILPGSELYPAEMLVLLREQDNDFLFMGFVEWSEKDVENLRPNAENKEFKLR